MSCGSSPLHLQEPAVLLDAMLSLKPLTGWGLWESTGDTPLMGMALQASLQAEKFLYFDYAMFLPGTRVCASAFLHLPAKWNEAGAGLGVQD